MSAATKGPWHVGGLPDWDEIIFDPDDWAIASVMRLNGRRSPEEAKANARLIAAAPDLLDALKRVMTLAVSVQGDEVFADVQAAIKKATA